MSHNQHWYPQNNGNYYPNDGSQRPPDPRAPNYSNSVQNGLLAVYPPASATPTHHVTRHISSMTLTVAPSFPQPNYYTPQNTTYPQANPPPYSEYDQQLNYLSSSSIPENDSGYWENTRNHAVRMLNEEAGPSYQYRDSSQWMSPAPPSSYQTTPFAQSVFQLTAPNTAYPTPPPPGISTSSSSLAFALGNPHAHPQPRQPPPVPRVYQPQESQGFYDDFLERKARQINPPPPPPPPPPIIHPEPVRIVTPPPIIPQPSQEESPDPLALRSGGAIRTMPATAVTPQKRKPIVEILSPSAKRLQAYKSSSSTSFGNQSNLTPQPSQSNVLLTPGSSATSISNISGMSLNATPTHKRINTAYVSVPLKPWLTPSSSRKTPHLQSGRVKMNIDDTPDDLGGYGSEELDPASPTKQRFTINDSVKSSARRTGDRDERGPLEKLTSLIEDIFEAEDTIPAEVEASDMNYELFSPLSVDLSRPLLSPAVIRKLTKYIGHVARPTKRLRQATVGGMGTPRGKGRMADVDTQMLSRLLKILDRSVKAGEDVDPFSSYVVAPSVKSSPKKPSTKKGVKAKKGERRSRSQTPKDGEGAGVDDEVMGDDRSVPALTDSDYDKLSTLLDTARDSILAADSCIALLGSDRLTKQLYSEELITACLNTIKNQLTKILYPFVEASSESGVTSNPNPILQGIIKNSNHAASGHRLQLGELFQALSAVIPRINNLVNVESVAMSDSITISAVYIAIGPFFVVGGGGEVETKGKKEKDNVVIKTLGKSAMRGLRLDALSLIRSIFANHEDQRSWIIEEILTSLIKLNDTKQKAGQFRLRDGRSIRTVSALLLQLVQTSAHDVRVHAKKIEKLRQNKFALRRQESFSESQQAQAQPEPFLDENDQEEIRLYGSALESATKAAKTIIVFLTQRSGKGKATKNSNEAEYRAIFDNFIEDLLVVLFWPEWPAASLILSIASKFMVSSLDDVKTNSQADTNAAKQMALDHLGVIAAKIRTSVLKFQRDVGNSANRPLKALDEIVSSISLKRLNRFLEAHQDVASHLSKRSSEDQAYDSARELTAATLGQELSAALRQVHGWLEHPEADEDLNIKDESKTLAFGQQLKAALREVWKELSTDVFDVGSQEEALRVDELSEEIGTIQSLRNSFQPILSIILMALDAPHIFMRTKALKALGQIVTSDSTILSAPNVRRGIESHLLDNSPAVRDAAVELIGKYMVDSPEVAGDYYQKIADRIADTGLGVRKRVIKLLKSFYSVTTDNHRRIDIATRLVLRMLDEDDTVKDLSIKAIEELWFPPMPLPSALKTRTQPPINAHDKAALLAKVSVIMGTSANFKDRQSPLEDVLHKIMAEKEGGERSSLHARYTEICEALIDGLVDASDLPGFTVINCIRTIYLLTSAHPSILSGNNASTLLPYLKNASTPEELTTSDYLFKIFKVSIPHMPKTAAKFGHELQAALQPMIIKPSGAGGIQILQETVGCMCVVVQYLTHDFVRLVNLLKSCNGRLQQIISRPASQESNDIRALIILIFIVALLTENCKFDVLRKEHPNLTNDLNGISSGSITEHIYMTLLTLYDKHDNSSLRGRILQCLGFLFRAQPTLMTMERSARIMDEIFSSPEEEGKGRLLKIIQDFLISEAEKHAAKEKESSSSKNKPLKTNDVNMEELVGNTDGFADSGVSSAIVQRYLNHVLEAALSQNPQIQTVAIDVLSFTIKQGLAHPLQSFPVIVALETSTVTSISSRASALHAILQGKHSSLLNTRYTISARKSFDYQKKVAIGPVQGFRFQPGPVALLQRWYSHVREKRPTRQDFLKSLVKIFQESDSFESSQDDVHYTRYMAENFAAFDYKTQEEILTVIKYLTSVLSTTGMQLLEIVSPSHLLTHLHAPSQSQPQADAAATSLEPGDNDAMGVVTQEPLPNADAKEYDKAALMRTSVIIAIVMLLKAHLKALYSLSEDKCNKFVIGKKSAIGDKPATKRNDTPISWHRLPFATTPLLTTEDAESQKARFLEIWNEDGLTAEPEEEDFL